MSNRYNIYKIITVDRQLLHPMQELEIAVNEFLNNNEGFVPNAAPVAIDDDVIQILVSKNE